MHIHLHQLIRVLYGMLELVQIGLFVLIQSEHRLLLLLKGGLLGYQVVHLIANRFQSVPHELILEFEFVHFFTLLYYFLDSVLSELFLFFVPGS